VLDIAPSFFWGARANGSKLLIRSWYVTIFETFQKAIQSTRQACLGVFGTPGTGKTFLVFYVMTKLLPLVRANNPHPRILISRKSGEDPLQYAAYLITVEPVLQTLDIQHVDLSYASNLDMDDFYFADDCSPIQSNAHVFVVASGLEDDLKLSRNYIKRIILYLPTWSFAEIELYNSKIAPMPELYRRYVKCGGSIRSLLDDSWFDQGLLLLTFFSSDPLNQCLSSGLDMFLNISDVSQLAAMLQTPSKKTVKKAGRVIHMDVKENLLSYETIAASSYVSEKLAELMTNRKWTNVVDFLQNSDSWPTLGSFRGQLFEGFAHYSLKRGGTFFVKKLGEKGAPYMMTFEHRPEVFFLKGFSDPRADSVGRASGVGVGAGSGSASLSFLINPPSYARPVSKIQAGFDALYTPDRTLSFTISSTHSCDEAALDEVISTFSLDHLHHFTAVPEGFIWESWCLKQPRAWQNPNLQNKVTEYILMIPFPSPSPSRTRSSVEAEIPGDEDRPAKAPKSECSCRNYPKLCKCKCLRKCCGSCKCLKAGRCQPASPT
jgi:hypothetical protein